MRCKKAQDFIFSNCDELLNEAEKMQLLEHLDGCPSCARMAKEIEACREMVNDLPELSPSESFEWNLKRRIVQEKAKTGRGSGVTLFGEWRWGFKFAARKDNAAAEFHQQSVSGGAPGRLAERRGRDRELRHLS